ncbi:MarR family winged helix-turn-helix transcriptional regulator [Heyndrickxia sp. NPDC080065]|uniref:MarR family winged helix-turn-helix transcriptional regulator n=1 Tax=Heyndrickxia sp. NPDC080065 TaxID=3390568 RepID=UPI003CFCA8B2
MEFVNYTEDIRRFNRFYTRIIGVNNQYTDQTKYSSTEAQILYEISIKEKCTAAYLRDYFKLDKGYLSRILKRFENEVLIIKTASNEDKRVSYLHITEHGTKELNSLINTANRNVYNMIEKIPVEELDELIQSMRRIESILKNYENEIYAIK